MEHKSGLNMKIPRRIKIGGHWFSVLYKSDSKDGFEGSGRKSSWANQIILQTNAVQSKKESTLIHEIIHEIAWQHELGLSESQVSTIAEGFYQVLLDNRLLARDKTK
jgi:hypothetical protein